MAESTIPNLARIRAMKGYTQTQLAAAAGLTQETISLYENGRQKPFPESLKKIAIALDCSLDELFGINGT